ncbi:GGDEF domain-containing protein [Flavobacterium sp. MXW15]|uniref:diguanylate cyclase n=1 Tax=Xanthomonas chitinilytica TaxID=2989819 RepID=A0ABT3JV10_9XANT|nr:GGDEF domain-containing protein [Xanthomonas sp. H13-6]MCW4453310.1 GGDEF domain-containing protein [Flavobacterium sp. MXW15]MCW4472337.1 GGDEF domain-containing protein [Xanthomonas sp. H13-6]
MSPELINALALCRNLPSPPGIALRVIELAQDPEADLATAAEVIAMDMALSARMLRIANSPLYASRRRINNLGQALTMLGLNATLQLALGFSIAQGLQGQGDGRAADMSGRIWHRSVLAALSARLLGQASGVRKAEELMLAGLLQDIGILALIQAQPDAYPSLLRQADSNPALLALEQRYLGITHADAGAAVAREWNLPHYLVEAIAASEPPAAPQEPFQACVALSGCVADIWLADDTDAAREQALQQVHARLQLDSTQFDQVLAQIGELLPDIGALFEVQILSPARVTDLIEHARELATLRNLREQQDAALAHQRADESESRANRLAELAHRDALTGVLNRRQLEAVLEQEFSRATRHDWPLSVAFIDLDDFKKINDIHGHLIGDQVLRAFAGKLQELLRGTDTVARFGGEEFIVLFPNTPEAVALEVIRRLLATISATPMAEVDGNRLHVTFSAGVAAHGGYERFADVQELLKAADDVLYRSKSLGRNRVIARAPQREPTQC